MRDEDRNSLSAQETGEDLKISSLKEVGALGNRRFSSVFQFITSVHYFSSLLQFIKVARGRRNVVNTASTTLTTAGETTNLLWRGMANGGASLQGVHSKDALIKLDAPSRVLPQSGDTRPVQLNARCCRRKLPHIADCSSVSLYCCAFLRLQSYHHHISHIMEYITMHIFMRESE